VGAVVVVLETLGLVLLHLEQQTLVVVGARQKVALAQVVLASSSFVTLLTARLLLLQQATLR
jgi:hypothetical protein